MTWEGMQVVGEESDGPDRFPWLVTIGSLAVGLWIFLSSTVDACRERDALDAAEQRLTERRNALRDRVIERRSRRADLPYSGDLLMVELDRQGLLPDDLSNPDFRAPDLNR